MRKWALIWFLLVSLFVSGQRETNIWYFGRYAGLSFAGGKPVALLDSKLKTEEGTSVISDKQGRLLFYTNGVTVWNADHVVMKNGMNLQGDPSSTQSSVVIARPGMPGKYYLFTTAASAKEPGLCYSAIDMSLEGGKGDVVPKEKNVGLHTPVAEKITAVPHRNGKDTWLIAHAWKSNEFLAYLVTEQGVSQTPVSSRTGTVHGAMAYDAQGYMKASPDGSNLALALEISDIVEVLDFDNQSGAVSNPVTIKARPKSYVYGIEFSPDGSLLYYSAGGVGEIWQVNLQAGSEKEIQASAVMAGQVEKGKWIGALQLAGDGKIYFTIHETTFLGVIEHPDVQGAGCGYKNYAVSVAPRIVTLGLPNFAQGFFAREISRQVAYFSAAKMTTGKSFVLKGVNFDFAKFSLQSSSYAELDQLVVVLKKNKGWKITVTGHTDNTGNKSSNIVLSESRAQSVKDYLVQKGVAAERITCAGYGSSQPLASNATEAGRAKNRRVEVRLD